MVLFSNHLIVLGVGWIIPMEGSKDVGSLVSSPYSEYKQGFVRLVEYHRWAYIRLLGQIDKVTEDEVYRKDLGLYFKSIHGTINRTYVC